MVLRRITTSLRQVSTGVRDQNWTAIGIEFVLVILGVFLGIMAANWNQERLERRETQKLLEQVDVTLTGFLVFLESMDDYYASTDRYGDVAIAGWGNDRAVSDEEFVIAAYQASQIIAVGNNGVVFGAIFGAENLRDIDDSVIRQNLAAVMTYDYELVDLRAVSTRYREEVRKTIPHEIQSAIRAHCGDQLGDTASLPTRCDFEFSPGAAGRAAAALRGRPELIAELHWHRAAVANQLSNVDALKDNVRALTERMSSPK